MANGKRQEINCVPASLKVAASDRSEQRQRKGFRWGFLCYPLLHICHIKLKDYTVNHSWTEPWLTLEMLTLPSGHYSKEDDGSSDVASRHLALYGTPLLKSNARDIWKVQNLSLRCKAHMSHNGINPSWRDEIWRQGLDCLFTYWTADAFIALSPGVLKL